MNYYRSTKNYQIKPVSTTFQKYYQENFIENSPYERPAGKPTPQTLGKSNFMNYPTTTNATNPRNIGNYSMASETKGNYPSDSYYNYTKDPYNDDKKYSNTTSNYKYDPYEEYKNKLQNTNTYSNRNDDPYKFNYENTYNFSNESNYKNNKIESNYGNTKSFKLFFYFRNSILQCLFHLPVFSDFFYDGNFKMRLNKKNYGISEAFANLLQKVRKNSMLSRAESTFDLKRAIANKKSTFSSYNQEDAQEFLKFLLEGMHDELNKVSVKPKYKELKSDEKNPQKTSDEWFNYMKGFDDSLITDLFCGQFYNKIICKKCNNSESGFDNFWDLSLSFPRISNFFSSSEDIDMDRILKDFLKIEELEQTCHCSKCKSSQRSEKITKIWKLPEILVIHLKRFSYSRFRRDKLNHKIRFPLENLDMRNYCDSSDKTLKDGVYKLFGIVNHSGVLNGGHYIAECRNPFDNNWYRYDDDSVSGLNPYYDKCGSSSPYILFYCKNNLS